MGRKQIKVSFLGSIINEKF